VRIWKVVQKFNNWTASLGFNATVKDELIVKLTGSHKKVIKIKFKKLN
jgi:hypothetical protein